MMKKQEKPALVGTAYAIVKNQTATEIKVAKHLAKTVVDQLPGLLRMRKLSSSDADKLTQAVLELNMSAEMCLDELEHNKDESEGFLLGVSNFVGDSMDRVRQVLENIAAGKRPTTTLRAVN